MHKLTGNWLTGNGPAEKQTSAHAALPARRIALARTRTLQRGAIVSPPAIKTLRPAYVPGKAVGTFVPKLTQKAFEKYGFSTATLLTDWARIVGADLARDTAPERLKWPRGTVSDETGTGGATLVLRVDPARALDVSYKERQIMERINTYFGYRAIEALRIIQAPIASQRPAEPRQTLRVPLEPGVAPIKIGHCDAPPDALSQALARLEAGVRARAAASVPARG